MTPPPPPPQTAPPAPTPLGYQPQFPGAGASHKAMLRSVWDATGMLLVLLILLAVVSLFVPNFFTARNASGLLLSVTTVGILACTMLFCLAAGDVDLSVGSVVAMSGVLAAMVVNATGSVTLAIAAGTLAGALVGIINGVVVAQFGINALIATLATMQIAKGVGYIICDGTPVGVSEERFWDLGIGSMLGVGTPVWIMLAAFVVFGVLLKRTIFGRNTLAVGGNLEAARLAGIRVRLTRIVIFTVQGMVAGLAGVVLAARMTSGQPKPIDALELRVISACVLGGVSLTGGVGTMLGVIVGVLIMGIVDNAMNLRNVPTFYQYVASGGILLAAVLFDRLKQRWA